MPAVPGAVVPARVAVPFAWAVNVTPAGSAPDIEMVVTGNPTVVTVNVAGTPRPNVVDAALVIAGA